MNPLNEALRWLGDPANWEGNDGIAIRLFEHVQISVVALVAASMVALPVGLLIGHTRRWEGAAVSIASLGRALPSFGVLAIVFPFTLRYLPGIGYWPTLIALFFLAIPPILTNCYVGVQGTDPDTVEAARGMGMTGTQVLRGVEIPHALPLIIAGLRTSAVQVIATATLGAVVAWGGLGRFIVDGFAQRDPALTIGGAILVAALAIVTELSFGLVERSVARDERQESLRSEVAPTS